MIAGQNLRGQAEALLKAELKRSKGGSPNKLRAAERLEMLQALNERNAETYQRMMRIKYHMGGPWV